MKERDDTLISRLDVPLQKLAHRHLWHIRRLIRTNHVPARVRLIETSRTPERQAELYAQGRTTPGAIVTNAQPEDTPHCFQVNGRPAARAWDVWLLHPTEERILGDGDPLWGLIPFAVGLLNAEKLGPVLRSGAFWRSPQDWPHVEQVDWRSP